MTIMTDFRFEDRVLRLRLLLQAGKSKEAHRLVYEWVKTGVWSFGDFNAFLTLAGLRDR